MAYQLFFKFDLTGRVYLDGAGISAPVKGARYSPGGGRREVDALGRQVISEVISVELTGTYTEISDWITALDVKLELLKAGAWRESLLHFPVVCIQEPDAPAGETIPYWFSELLDAWLFLDPGGIAQRELGHQLVTINIKRLDRWKYTGGEEPDIIIGDLDYTQAQQGFMLNHFDATNYHTNWGYVSFV